MSVITSGTMPSNLLPIATKAFDGAKGKVPAQHLDLFDKGVSSGRSQEEMFSYHGLGTTRHKPEGTATELDSMGQLWNKTITHKAYGLGMIITREAEKDGQILSIVGMQAKALRRAVDQNRNISAGLLYDAFFTTETTGDGVAVCSTSHVIKGGTASNRASVDATFSEVSLEQGYIDIEDMVDYRGLKTFVNPTGIVVPNNLKYKAQRLAGSDKRVETADNDTNLHKGLKITSAKYLTSATQWYIRTDVEDSLLFFEREAPFLYQDLAYDTLNKRFAVYHREAFGVGNWQGIYGNAPA